MHQYIGLILLCLAVAAGIYIISHGEEVIQLKLPLPAAIQSVVAPFSNGDIPSTKPAQEIKETSFWPDASSEIAEPEPRKLVKIKDINWPAGSDPMEVVLAANLEKGESVNITGWTIKNNFNLFTIPKAQEVYVFNGSQGDIVLKYRDTVYFYGGRAIKGNFRLNKCMGYIEDFSPFSPSIPRSCPRIYQDQIDYLDGYCQDYILSLRACENPSANPPVRHDDFACYDYLKTLNYAGCVEKYGNDDDFLLKEWRVWLDDKINIFDRIHDKIQLIDKEGNVVDEYKY